MLSIELPEGYQLLVSRVIGNLNSHMEGFHVNQTYADLVRTFGLLRFVSFARVGLAKRVDDLITGLK
jgi:hypothetical protein